MKATFRFAVLLMAVLYAGPVAAQMQGVQLEVRREHLGLSDQAKLGKWTPIRLDLTNESAEPRQVVCRWLLHDTDGDRVMAERRVTLDAMVTQQAWLYGPLPVRWRQQDPWVIQVLNEDASEELARVQVAPATLIHPVTRTIGIAGVSEMKLNEYAEARTSHETVRLVTGLSLTTLPDKWYGLSGIDTLIWTKQGGEPDDPLVSSASQQALREWVRRGGHLVVLLPAYGETWTGSGLSDLLPVKGEDILRVEGPPPNSILGAPRGELIDVEMSVFLVGNDPGVDVIRRHEDRPIIVAKPFGLGRVTLIGFDLTDSRFTQMGMPSGRYPVWNDVFMWQAPVYSQAYTDAEVEAGRMSRPDQRTHLPLGRFIPGRISMRGTAAPALLGAVLLFALYWFASGPLSLIVLKKKEATRHSWVVFVGVVLVFSAVSWAGAWLLAPKSAGVSHFSVLTARADSPTVHTHSWLSLYIPKFSTQVVEIEPDREGVNHTLASPGLFAGLDETGFLDPQTYALDVGSPKAAGIPFRSTAKQLEADYLGRIDQKQAGLSEPIVMPQGEVTIRNNMPAGKLSHGLPGALRDVHVIYCPGEILRNGEWSVQTPLIWRALDLWEPGQSMQVQPTGNVASLPLVVRPNNYNSPRAWKQEGWLGLLIDTSPGQKLIDAAGAELLTSSSETIQYIQILSFFDTLPPPDFRKTGWPWAVVFNRGLGRELDLTPMLSGKRLIVMGHMEDGPLPMPLTVGGEEVEAKGWTVVRWVYDFK